MRWQKLCAENTNVWDQALLTLAWFQTVQKHDFSTQFLPNGIIRFPRPKIRDWRDLVFFYPWKRKIRPFIYQKQASRKLKAYISESPEIIREIGSDDIQPNFRDALKRFDFSVPINSIADVFRLHEH